MTATINEEKRFGGNKFPSISPMLFTGFGDSITGQSIYFPPGYTDANVQTWTPSTNYGANEQVQYGGWFFWSGLSGGTSGVTPPVPGATNDGGINWTIMNPVANKQGTSYLFWAEAFSNGKLRWDMDIGFAGPWFGLKQIRMRSRGSGYAPGDTANFNNGGKGTLIVNPVDGGIDGVTITSPGYGTTGVSMTSITTSTGSGATWTHIRSCAGNFGVPGATTVDMNTWLADVIASPAKIIVYCAGTNDVTAGTAASVITANYKQHWDAIQASGKALIIIPIPPRGVGLTPTNIKVLNQCNRYARAYARGEAWANTYGYANVSLADVGPYWTDAASTSVHNVIGGTGGVDGAMTNDGVHPSERGAMYLGWAVWEAAQQFVGGAPAFPSRFCSQYDGFDPSLNNGGNMLEGDAWETGKTIVQGAHRSNAGNVYVATQGGTTSTAPTGTGTNIVDNTVRWDYCWPSGMSVMNSASQAAAIVGGTPAGITLSGNMPSGYTFGRQSGSATGTITHSIESPWSNGVTGKRWKIVFSLGSGTNGELWYFKLPFKNNYLWGLLNADLATAFMEMEAELELSGVANVNYFQLYGPQYSYAYGNAGPSTGGAGRRIMNSSGEMLSIPNGGKILLRSQKLLIPAANTSVSGTIYVGFDASGGAGSATLTLYLNYIAARKAGLI